MKAEWTNSDSLTTSQTTKAILVIDVPMLYDGRHLCNECPIWNDEHWFCQYDFNMEAKGCPLRKIPQKESEKHREEIEDWTGLAYSQGWNDCIDVITGETE